jgi:hypothetical protein
MAMPIAAGGSGSTILDCPLRGQIGAAATIVDDYALLLSSRTNRQIAPCGISYAAKQLRYGFMRLRA